MSAAPFTAIGFSRRSSSHEPDALATREVDNLVSQLLGEIKIPFGSLTKRVVNHLADLKKILAADYLNDSALPDKA